METLEQTRVVEDLYPSRRDNQPKMISRKDPVIYNDYTADAPLSQRQYDHYQQNGYLLLDNLFSDAEVATYIAELERLRYQEGLNDMPELVTESQSDAFRSLFRVHQLSDVFAKLAQHPRLVEIVQYILDDDLSIHQSRLNYKPGFVGKEFYWHSDFETWHVEDGMPRMRALSASITLTENFAYNGPLMVMPGSHQHYVSCVGETPAEHYKMSLKKQEYGVPDPASLSWLAEEYGIDTPLGKPGSVILFDCNLMHGSNGNITPHPRSNAFFVYNAESNKIGRPFGSQPPRPDYIAARTKRTTIPRL